MRHREPGEPNPEPDDAARKQEKETHGEANLVLTHIVLLHTKKYTVRQFYILPVQCMVSRRIKHSTSPSRAATQSREKIISTALKLIEEEGLEAFSTRKLGSRLGLKVMSLYHYFPSREALLDAAVDHMIAEVPLPDISRVGWRQGLQRLARAYRAMGRRHLQAIPLLAQRCPSSQTMQSFLDTLSGLLLKAGLTPAIAADWLVIQRDYVIGSLMAEHAASFFPTATAALNVPSDGTNLERLRLSLARGIRKQAFEKGFTAMLDAIERER